MSQNTFTHTSIQSPTSRFKNALGGIVFGLILMIAGMVLLFWNEGRAVKRIRTLEEGKASVVQIDSTRVLPENNEHLVYLSGMTSSDSVLIDSLFDIKYQGISLDRSVEMYQWVENKDTTTKEDSNGNEIKSTTYSYSKQWSSTAESSANFTHPENHTNPTMPFRNETFMSSQVNVGAFTLSSVLTGKIKNASIMPLADYKIPQQFASKSQITGDEIYIGKDPQNPQIGDMRVWFSITAPCIVSIIAQQDSNLLTTYYTDNGTLEVLKNGTLSSDELFAAEAKSNSLITWGIRAGGFVLVWVGFAMVFEIFNILAVFIPFISSLIRAGIGALVFAISATISLVTIALGWIVYRPILGYSLIGTAMIMLAIPFLKKRNGN